MVEGVLPAHLEPFFWDYDFSSLRWESDRDLIIARILAVGDWEALQWLLRQEGKEGLREWIRARRGRGLDARRLRFWELVLDLPRREVNRWLRELRRDSWPGRSGG
ncbi:MAG: hypothetical protein HY690_08030 [Chloroflexi bacterium]|nr:hypothetical protein [Chloroflexota bacterium]